MSTDVATLRAFEQAGRSIASELVYVAASSPDAAAGASAWGFPGVDPRSDSGQRVEALLRRQETVAKRCITEALDGDHERELAKVVKRQASSVTLNLARVAVEDVERADMGGSPG